MIKLEKYTGARTYMFPTGRVATPEVMMQKYPAIEHFTHIVQVSGDTLQAIYGLSSLREQYGIDPEMSESAAIMAIQNIMNEPEPELEPSPEERIAAALEFQNLLSL